jgi:hypothetical protein
MVCSAWSGQRLHESCSTTYTAADARAEATYNDADAVIHETVKIQDHLAAQDALLVSLINGAARKNVP